MTNPARSAEGRARFAAIQRAVRLSAQLSTLSLDDPKAVQAAFEELIGKPVGPGFLLIPPFSTDYGVGLTVGANVFINQHCHFMDLGGISIGDEVMIGPGVSLISAGHPLAAAERRRAITTAPIVIGRNAWIGARATVLAGVTIGEGAVVAAGAVVSRDVAPATVVAGVPARVIRCV